MSFRRFGIRLTAVGILFSAAMMARAEEAGTSIIEVPSIEQNVVEKATPAQDGNPVQSEQTDAAKTDSAKTVEQKAVESTPIDLTPPDTPATASTEAAPKTAEPKLPAETKLVVEPKKPRPVDPTMELVERAIIETSKRRLTAGVHTPWQVVHGILALRWEMALLTGNGKDEINAIEWMASNPKFDGLPMWELTQYGGRGQPFTRPYAFEGHPTQFMGYMTMANIPPNYEFKAGDRTITIRDIMNDAKMQVREGPEITWTLWALSHYEDPEAQWINNIGEPWSIERMLRLQINEAVTEGACGGTHGLFALSYARNMYFSTGKPLRGTWLEADQKIKRYVMEARMLQNSDGSFSANHFNGPGYSEEFAKRIATSGHQLEWLMVALPQSKLKEDWLQAGIRAVAKDLIEHRKDASDCGPLYHGLHALMVYRQRTVPGYEDPCPKKIYEMVKMKRQWATPEKATAEKQDKPATKDKAGSPVASSKKSAPEKELLVKPSIISSPRIRPAIEARAEKETSRE